MSLPAKTGLSLALKLKNGYPPMGGGTSRFYTIFDPGYVDMVTPWVASGDFEIEFSLVANDLLDNYAVLGDDVSGLSNILYVDSASALRIRIASGSFAFLATIDSTNLHNYTVTRVNGSITVKQDGSTIGSPVSYLGTFTVSLVAARTSSLFILDGIVYNVSLKDLDNPSNSRYYPLDTDSLTIARETLNADGEELNKPLADSMWVQQGGGIVTPTSDNSFTFTSDGTGLKMEAVLDSTKAYKIVIEGMSNMDVWFGLSGADAQKLLGDGEYIISPNSGNEALYFRGSTAGIASFANISVKETTDALYIDVQSEDKIQELP